MPRYYFDMRIGDEIAPDEEGMELSSIRAVQQEAAHALAKMASADDLLDDDDDARYMSIEVRGDQGPVLEVKFVFKIDWLRN